jgi:hypothetical protein
VRGIDRPAPAEGPSRAGAAAAPSAPPAFTNRHIARVPDRRVPLVRSGSVHRLLPIFTVVCLLAPASPARAQVATPVTVVPTDPVVAAQQRIDAIGVAITDAQAQVDAAQASLDA